ncbi:hypothetical protein CYMTET_46356 [Cymbomonas tetramitiformis]|uniref:Uncharacterized protein n=1 Tax=Cymbomonas tetramitiformis TaxID=36881 RepID=A0AAE0BWA6_9CHLO|nr:hypothetical protein CYMTET_46356 [Cymbomonas tetramitiformis]
MEPLTSLPEIATPPSKRSSDSPRISHSTRLPQLKETPGTGAKEAGATFRRRNIRQESSAIQRKPSLKVSRKAVFNGNPLLDKLKPVDAPADGHEHVALEPLDASLAHPNWNAKYQAIVRCLFTGRSKVEFLTLYAGHNGSLILLVLPSGENSSTASSHVPYLVYLDTYETMAVLTAPQELANLHLASPCGKIARYSSCPLTNKAPMKRASLAASTSISALDRYATALLRAIFLGWGYNLSERPQVLLAV